MTLFAPKQKDRVDAHYTRFTIGDELRASLKVAAA